MDIGGAGDHATNIVRVGMLFLIGMVVLGGIDSGASNSGVDSILITMTGNPIDGELMQLDNNIFEFDIDDNVVSGHIPVNIGATLTETIANLDAAISTAGYMI